MAKARMGAKLAAGCLVFFGGLAPAMAVPTVAHMLSFKPHQEGITYSKPTEQEQQSCKVELVSGARQGSSGWLLRDPNGKPMRRFFASNGKQIDVFSYYQDGVEVYREVDSNGNERVDQFRWLNTNGMKWGIDHNEDGKIDAWKIISADEVSQEILKALIHKDFERLQALFLTEAEMKAIDLSPAEITRLTNQKKQATAKFQDTVTKLGLDDKTKWLRLEAPTAQCVPAEQTGMKHDVIRQQRGTILYEKDGKHDWIQTGEMLQVGLAWRLVDAPAPGDAATPSAGDQAPGIPMNKKLQALLEELRQLDLGAPQAPLQAAPNPAVVSYNLKRAELLEKILAEVTKPEDRDQWLRQIADCYSAAAQASSDGDKTAMDKLLSMEKQLEKDQVGSNLTAYVTFKEMSADYALKLANGKSSMFVQNQKEWLDRLAKFVQTYPKADDTPDALIQAGMVNEFLNKETEAKNWYDRLAKDFPTHALAAKATGASRRLDCEGKPFELTGQLVGGGTFDMSRLHGKVAIVYYWASWNGQSTTDFAKLKVLMAAWAPKGVELVCVNLDNSPPEASESRTQIQAHHLYHPGGLESPLATQYGVMVLPHLFLVDKNGKVASRTVQINNLEDELKKLIK